jgi:O-antigen/teichoic acid export membrane protein
VNADSIPGRSFVWNAAALSAAQLCSPLLNAALIILMARSAGPEILGAYTLLVTAFMVVDQLRLFGLQRLVTRELAARRTSGLYIYRGFIGVSDASGVVAVLLLTAYGLMVGVSPVAVAIFAVGLIPSGRASANDALFLALGRADCTTRVVVAECAVRMALSLMVVWFRGADLAALGAAYGVGRLLAAALGARYRRQLFGAVDTSRDWTAAGALIGHIPAFFAVTALPLLLLRADLLVVGGIGDARDLGLYGAAARLVGVMLLVPDGIMLANFARLSQMVDRSASRRSIGTLVMGALLVLAPLAVLVTFFAAEITTLIYGDAFEDSGRYLAWLVWSVPLFVACRAVGDMLVAAGYQRRLAFVILCTIAASIPLYMVLVRSYDSTGVAIAYLGSLIVLLVGSVIVARPVLAQSAVPRDSRSMRAEASVVAG